MCTADQLYVVQSQPESLHIMNIACWDPEKFLKDTLENFDEESV